MPTAAGVTGFRPVIKKLTENYPSLQVEVLSGGMILSEEPVPIAATAAYIQKAYPTVEELTGIKFGAELFCGISIIPT